jgi:hypothetical protein
MQQSSKQWVIMKEINSPDKLKVFRTKLDREISTKACEVLLLQNQVTQESGRKKCEVWNWCALGLATVVHVAVAPAE